MDANKSPALGGDKRQDKLTGNEPHLGGNKWKGHYCEECGTPVTESAWYPIDDLIGDMWICDECMRFARFHFGPVR